MRFARQCSIFRGPVDPVPLIGVLFLLVIFMLLASLLYTPGVLVQFDPKTGQDDGLITVARNGNVIFNGQTNRMATLERFRAEDLKNATNQVFRLKVEPGADSTLVEAVRRLFQVTLPNEGPGADYLTGTDNPTVVVAVNFRGQYFFENRLVQDAELQSELRHRLEKASRASKKLTVILAADKTAAYDDIMRLYRLARAVGVSDFLQAEQPNPFAAPPRLLTP